MPTAITGDPSLVSNTLSRNITSATNTTPIIVTTSVPHLFADGDEVEIEGVVGNAGANGTFNITVLSATTFSLDSSAGTGAYVSGGTVVDNYLTPAFNIPSDGDARNAASVSAAFEMLAARDQFMNLAIKAIEPQIVKRVDVFTANGTWTCPDNVYWVILTGSGGGGGGGGGAGGARAVDVVASGGGGGGGAPWSTVIFEVTPGVVYPVVIGTGGAGGAGGAGGVGGGFGANGDNGTGTYFGGVPSAGFDGGGGGCKGVPSVDPINDVGIAFGGPPSAQTAGNVFLSPEIFSNGYGARGIVKGNAFSLQKGGDSITTCGGAPFDGRGMPGGGDPQNYNGGAGGSVGANAGATNWGGSGGGGGAAGFGNNGGPGGNGGDAKTGATNGDAGVDGTDGGSIGAGGGGGGAGGATSGGLGIGGNGGAGGDGGPGVLYIAYIGPQAVIT